MFSLYPPPLTTPQVTKIDPQMMTMGAGITAAADNLTYHQCYF